MNKIRKIAVCSLLVILFSSSSITPLTIKPAQAQQQTSSEVPSDVQSGNVKVDGTNFSVEYSITNGKVLGMVLDLKSASSIISIQTTGDGTLTITLPRELIDAQVNGQDDHFFVLNNGQDSQFEETGKTTTDRTLSIPFTSETEEIEIIGTKLISPESQPTQETSFSSDDTKNHGCKQQYDSDFYYDSSQDKCMPPTGSWEDPGMNYNNHQCENQFGTDFYYDVPQNACLPPSGSWEDPGATFYDHQCQDLFWPDFYYDVPQNACLPPNGSWKNFVKPQTGVTDQQGRVTFQISGQDIQFNFVDDITGLPLSGLNTAFALDPTTQSVGAIVIVDPTNKHHTQFVVLQSIPSNSITPTSWKENLIPNASAVTLGQVLISVANDPKTIITVAVVTATSLPLIPAGIGAASVIATAGTVFFTYDAIVLAAKALDKSEMVNVHGYLQKYFDTGTVTIHEAGEEIGKEGVNGGGYDLLSVVGENTVKTYLKEQAENPSFGGHVLGGAAVTIATGYLDLDTLRKCNDPDTQQLKYVQVLEKRLYFCESKDDNPYGLLKYDPPEESGHISLELVSKANPGFFQNIQTDAGQPIQIPADDYSVKISSPGKSPITQDVTVSEGQITTFNIKQNVDNNLSTLLDKGNDLVNQDKYEEALQYYLKALEIDPNNTNVLNKIGKVYAIQKDYDTAKEYFEKAIQVDPKFSHSLVNLGHIYDILGKYEEAITYYKKALEIDSNNVFVLSNLGTDYAIQKDYDTAKEYFEKAIQIKPDPETLTNLGRVYAIRGDYDTAKEYVNKALELDPNNKFAQENMERIQKLQEDNAKPIISIINGECTIHEHCKILIATASGGSGNIHFQSDTFANGAPPMGMSVDLNGYLSGTPSSSDGTYNFGICAVDDVGNSSCDQVTVTINPTEKPIPVPDVQRGCIASVFHPTEPNCNDESENPYPTTCNSRLLLGGEPIPYSKVREICR